MAAQVRDVAAGLGIEDLHVLPVSALEGDNVVDRSPHTPWYTGPALLELLESLPGQDEIEATTDPFRLPVQLVLRPQGGLSPEIAPDEQGTLPRLPRVRGSHRLGLGARGRPRSRCSRAGSRRRSRASTSAGAAVDAAVSPESVAVQLADDVDAARGAVLTASGTAPAGTREFAAELFQLDARALATGTRVLVKHGTATVQALVEITSRYDLDTLTHDAATTLATNDIGRARLRLAADLPLEPYADNRPGGSFLVIHPSDGATLAAGTVLS